MDLKKDHTDYSVGAYTIMYMNNTHTVESHYSCGDNKGFLSCRKLATTK